jgi:hypothetical protein
MHLPPYSPLLANIIWHNILIPILCGVCGYLLTGYLVIIPSSTAVIYHVCSWVLGYLAHYVVSVAHRSSISHKIAKLADTGNLAGLTIPIVPSEYPFRLDILLQWMNEGRTEYLGDGMIVRLSKRFGKVNGRRIKTFNTKVLGENSVRRLYYILAFSIKLISCGPSLHSPLDNYILGTSCSSDPLPSTSYQSL